MLNDELSIEPERRGTALKVWQRRLAWSDDSVAEELEVSSDLLYEWMECVLPIPDEKWAVLAEVLQRRSQHRTDVAVIVGVTSVGKVFPVEVVTNDSYEDHIVGRDGRSGVLSITLEQSEPGGQSVCHRVFDARLNSHGLSKLEAWGLCRRASATKTQGEEMEAKRYFLRRSLERHLRRAFVKLLIESAPKPGEHPPEPL
jgi:hypothetical protein